MKGSNCRLIEYMEGSKKQFIIPVYQRNYDWKIEHCKHLFDDLVKVITQKRESHFFGCIVSVYEPSGRGTNFLIIDGQQRLTTVSLLFLAMSTLIEQKVVTPEDPSLGQQIYEDYLVDKYQPLETRMKLKPVKNDRAAFGKLFNGANDHIKGSNLTTNYNYFIDRIKRMPISIDELFNAICRLEIINIDLNKDDRPQLIFESLNSTGLDLSEGDKIRNYILMNIPEKKQEYYYDTFWSPIEECTNYDVSAFIRDYLSIKLGKIPAQQKVYEIFKEYIERQECKADELLKELLAYAKRYSILLRGSGNHAKRYRQLDACIYRLNRLQTTVIRPFFLEVLRLFDEKTLDIDQVSEIFFTTESYILRRAICELPTNTLNKTFSVLHREIERYDNTFDSYVAKFKYCLLSKKDRARFPSDEEFAEEFAERPIYQMNTKHIVYLLERLNNFGTEEYVHIYNRYDEGDYSIEHIMPQGLTDEWIEALGEDHEQIHQKWLHRIANLTLTAYNSKYSNRPFLEKRDMKNGLLDSGLRLNASLKYCDQWTLPELEARSEALTTQALEIWSLPTTTYRPTVKQLDSYTLDDDPALLTGRSIIGFSYDGNEQAVDSWAEMLPKVLQLLYAEDSSLLMKLALSKDDFVAIHDSNYTTNTIKNVEICDGIFVDVGTSTQSKLTLLYKVFEIFHLNPEDLVFYLKDGDNTTSKDSVRDDLNRQYWSAALPLIKDAHKNGGGFHNVNVTNRPRVDCAFGISGFNIGCTVRKNMARVDLYLGKSNEKENEEAFQTLFAHKEEIERALGGELTWVNDTRRMSTKIAYELPGVSIENRDDWSKMAEFHATWSRKFYDVLVPYLVK